MKLKHQAKVYYDTIEDNTLYIKIEGVYIQKNALEAKDIYEKIINSKIQNVLLDYTDCKVEFNVHSIILKNTEVQTIFDNGVKKIAGIFPDMNDDITFFETFFTNRGFNLKAFSNKNDALVWINSI